MPLGRTALAILLSALALPSPATGQVRLDIPAGAISCDAPDADPWVGGLRDRVLSDDDLALHALDLHGSPVDCVGTVTSEFDGARFGLVRVSFANGAWLQVETMPPEVSIVTMTAPPGRSMDVEASREALRAYAEAVGLEIDWGSPSTTVEDRSRTESFWDPDPGLNASASLIFLDDALVALRVSMAP